MRPPFRRPYAPGVAACRVILFLAAAALAGCGRRGPLELPPGTPTQANLSPSTVRGQDRVLNDQDTPGLLQSPNQSIERSAEAKQQQIFQEKNVPPPINEPAPPQKPTFLLDPLL